jgi:cellulose biosynthesis protein BcsQ
LGNALADMGERVLLVDFDPQSNLSMSFGIERPDELAVSMHNILALVMEGELLPDITEYVICGEGLDIIPCNITLTIFKVKRKINPRIAISGILMTICDERTRLFREAKNLLDEHYGGKVRIFGTHIPSTVKVGEANYASRSVMDFDANSKAAIAYTEFAKEVSGDGGKH